MGMSNRGLTKVVEECGELVQVCAKKIAYPDGKHPGVEGDLNGYIADEIADVLAAIFFLIDKLGLDRDAIEVRKRNKLALFQRWDKTE